MQCGWKASYTINRSTDFFQGWRFKIPISVTELSTPEPFLHCLEWLHFSGVPCLGLLIQHTSGYTLVVKAVSALLGVSDFNFVLKSTIVLLTSTYKHKFSSRRLLSCSTIFCNWRKCVQHHLILLFCFTHRMKIFDKISMSEQELCWVEVYLAKISFDSFLRASRKVRIPLLIILLIGTMPTILPTPALSITISGRSCVVANWLNFYI